MSALDLLRANSGRVYRDQDPLASVDVASLAVASPRKGHVRAWLTGRG